MKKPNKRSFRRKASSRITSKDYEKVRREVLKRDEGKCKVCGSRRMVQVHHIKKWADYPTLRNNPENLITLCKKCHQKMWGDEENNEGKCLNLLANGSSVSKLNVKYQIWKSKQEEKGGGPDGDHQD